MLTKNHIPCIFLTFNFVLIFQCLEPAFLNEETAVNRYNEAALLAEKSAAFGITTEERREAERLFEEVAEIWRQQKENESMRDVIRSYNRMITFFLKTSRTKFPDLRYVQNFTATVWILRANVIFLIRSEWGPRPESRMARVSSVENSRKPPAQVTMVHTDLRGRKTDHVILISV